MARGLLRFLLIAASVGIGAGLAIPLGIFVGYDLVVNATSLGLKPEDPLPVDVARMDGHAALFDILLRNQPTPLVRAARERGLNAQAGFEMLIQQMPHYLDFFGHKEAANVVRHNADFLRELIYPPAMADEIHHPLRYHSASVA